MNFLDQPAFWVFLSSFFGGVFGLLRLYFVYLDRSNKKKSDLDSAVETMRCGNIQMSVDLLNGFMKRIEPMVQKHEVMMKGIQESISHISTIEKGLNSMSKDLVKNYDEFQRKLQNITISFQTTIDRVDAFDKKLSALGKVIVK